MTPVRAKRNSKAPNRFSSDNSRIETNKSIAGQTIVDYDTRTVTMTDDLTITKSSNKTKPTFREPLKVKLPKLKRPHVQTHEHGRTKTNKNTSSEQVKIHKIKLPFSIKKLANKQPSMVEPKTKPDYRIPEPRIQTHVEPPKVETRDEVDDGLNLSPFKEPSQRMDIVVNQSSTPNNSGIRCPCGVDDDLGVMVECENCATWQHGHCINVGSEDDAYEGYICAYCTMPQDKACDSLRYLSVSDKFKSRFEALETLKQKIVGKSYSEQTNSPIQLFEDSLLEEATENDAILTVDEISQSVNDLNRVMRSLKVKWRLYTSAAYETELRIWQNPVWSDEKQPESDKTFYFIHRCKANLKLNLCNMISRLEDRCQLINYAISLARERVRKDSGELSPDDEKKLNEATRSIESLNQVTKELRLNLSEGQYAYFTPTVDSN